MTGAFAFDLVGVFMNAPALWTTGAHLALAGVMTGVIAAIPGVVDFLHTVPPNSSGKKRAIRHMLSMVSAMVIFAFARWLRGDAANQPDIVILGIEALGTMALIVGGWLGGTLVSRNQVSVDHRYANAGKWQEDIVPAPMGNDPITISAGDLQIDQLRLLRAGDKRIVVGRTADGYVAFDDRCTHRGGSLAGGVMICGTVQCPWHGSQFDAATGYVKAGPAKESIPVYRVEARDGTLLIFGAAKA